MLRSLLARRSFPPILLLGLLLGAPGIASADAAAHALDPDPAAASEPSSGPGWGPILGACLGVLFGGVLAVWQIRGMKNRG